MADAEPVDERTWAERAAAVPDAPPPPRWVVPAATLAVGLACSLAGLSRGPGGLLAGLVAAVVVLVFSATSALPLRISQDLGDGRGAGLGVLLLNYVSRLAVSLLVLAVAVTAGVDRQVLGIAVIVCALVRVNLHLALLRWRRST